MAALALPAPGLQPRTGHHRKFWNALSRSDNSARGVNVSAEKSPSLSERVARALNRRVGLGKTVTIKQLAYTVRLSEQTIWSLMAGTREPRGETLLRLISFFDATFANEILESTGCRMVKLSDARMIGPLRKIEEGHRELREASGK